MKQYLEVMQNIVDNGEFKENRTGVGTYSIFGTQTRFDLRKGFPLVSTKEVNVKHILGEILWFVKGQTNVNDLNSKIWGEWAAPDGSIGPMYGKQLRAFETSSPNGLKTVDQLKETIELIKSNPNSRRIIMTTWNVGFIPDGKKTAQAHVEEGLMALAPCHGLVIQFHTHTDSGLSMQVYVRSNDWPIGTPYNIAGYAFLLQLVAHECGLEARDLVYTTGDTHIYENQLEGVKEQLARTPNEKLPFLDFLDGNKSMFEVDVDDFELVGYEPQAKIKMPVAV